MTSNILKKSFQIIWHHPILWFFGFLSTFFFFSLNEIFIIFSSSYFFSELEKTKVFFLPEGQFKNLGSFLLIIIFLGIFLSIFLAIFSEIFLILSVKKIKEEKDESLAKKSFNFLPKVLFLKIILVLFFLLFWIGFNFFKYLPDVFLFLFVFIFSLFGLILFFIIRYSIFYLLIEKNNLLKSIKNGFLFLGKNLMLTFKLSILLFLISSIYSFVMLSFLGGGVFSYPLRIFNFIFSNLLGKYGFWLVALLTVFFVLILQIVIIGLINSYQIVCWTYLFLKKRE